MPQNKLLPLSDTAVAIEADIRSRGLGPGDRYFTAHELGGLLGLSRATCDRALKELADRDIVHRRRNKGTHVSSNLAPQPASLVRSVYVLLSSDRPYSTLPREEIMNGLWRELPDIGLHCTVLPKGNEAR